jgi:hypothetical protein
MFLQGFRVLGGPTCRRSWGEGRRCRRHRAALPCGGGEKDVTRLTFSHLRSLTSSLSLLIVVTLLSNADGGAALVIKREKGP